MTQKELILAYIDLHGSILPAKMAGKVFRGTMFGSETSKRCRELRALPFGHKDHIISYQDGKFERFARQIIDMSVRPTVIRSAQPMPKFQPMNQLFQLEIREQ